MDQIMARPGVPGMAQPMQGLMAAQTTPQTSPYTQQLPPPEITQQAMGQLPIGTEQITIWNRELSKYKAGKAQLELRVRNAERWWKLRNAYVEDSKLDGKKHGFRSQSAWLHNVIVSKHADGLEAYPSPNILPREEGDRVEAWALTHIVPVILEQNDFEEIYDENLWQKLKTGTGIYMVSWDNQKLNGLGDISISRIDLLNIFWEPGIKDIQKSKYIFVTEVMDKDAVVEMWPELEGKVLGTGFEPTKMPTDDNVSMDNKTVIIDVYYKKGGKLHYAKYVGDNIIYATENDNTPYRIESDPTTMQPIQYTRAEQGLYQHGQYPFIFDTLYPIEGSPAGYGYIDVCANPQTRIDLLDDALTRNAVWCARPRYFERTDGSINEEEFLDADNAVVHVNGTLDDTSIRPISVTGLSGNYINVKQDFVNELRETSGNTETSTGSSTNGVTAASALAALQEAAGKGSRASTKGTYRAYKHVVYQVIELIRQFYDMPRQFRITGNMGVQKFISFRNEFMQPQWQGMMGGVDLGYRKPVYDIDVVPQKQSSYTKIAQNELAIQFYSMGFFNPQLADQALLTLGMMDFDGKDELMQKIATSAMQFQQAQMVMAMGGGAPMQAERAPSGVDKVELEEGKGEAANVTKARERANTASQPGGATV